MTILHVVDAFANLPFSGNPAAVCLLNAPADARWMQSVAQEMNFSETAFLHPLEDGFSLRWFTPKIEVDLCGHATLASAFTLWETGVLSLDAPARFQTRSGILTCRREDDWIAMDFPATPTHPVPTPDNLDLALGCEALACEDNGMDLLVEIADAAVLRRLAPNISELAQLGYRGIIVTAKSDQADYDFLSRFFAPSAGINEDPVTGSAHCALGPYWQRQLARTEFTAFQASDRGGVVQVSLRGDRTILRGQAVMMSLVEWLHG